MPYDFRCDHCGKLLSIEADPGSAVKCPHCKKKVTVPAILGSLPRPLVPPNAPQTAAAPPLQQPPPAETHEDEAVMSAMAHIMPWVISLFFHLGLALIMMFVAMVVVHNRIPKDVIVPNAIMSDDPGGAMNPSQDNPLRRATVKQMDRRVFKKADKKLSPNKSRKKIRLIGVAGGASASGGKVSFGLASAGGGGPRTGFFGKGGNAHHVVYVIDRSGSMVDTFDFVRQELLVSISKLKQIQDFHVILFSDGPAIENAPRRLIPALNHYKAEVARFLMDIRPQGKTDPVPALMRAFDVLHRSNSKPGRLLYLLTDGEFPDNAKVIAAVRGRNSKRDVLINTYLYGYRPETAVRVMKRIARENGGGYKYVSDDE